jgi:SAM-dependent methyltransferase
MRGADIKTRRVSPEHSAWQNCRTDRACDRLIRDALLTTPAAFQRSNARRAAEILTAIDRAHLKLFLQRAGLLDFAREVRDVASSAEWLRDNIRFWRDGAPDGLPIPPLRLVRSSTGTSSLRWMFEGGARGATSVAGILERNGCDIRSVGSLLDFGCGCGRVIRHWADLDADVRGCDYNRASIAWCRRNLRFAGFDVNGLAPPLPYRDSQFAVVYALSVFTHLPDALFDAWFDEMNRVLTPDGLLVISMHGEAYLGELDPEQQAQFRRGHAVVTHSDSAGTNRCGVYVSEQYLRTRLADAFDLLDFVPQGAQGNPPQDLILLRRRLRCV